MAFAEEKVEDFVILCMAAQKFNDKGAGEKLKEIFRVLLELKPDNIADDNLGGIFTGQSLETILNHIGDKSYVGAAFSDEETVKKALQRIKGANLGISVVVTGKFEIVFKILKDISLKPHTVNISLGIFGNKRILPEERILRITSMCGHGMVTPGHVKIVLKKVKAGKMTSMEGAIDLARSCTCGIFNPKIASQLIDKYIHGG
jgi:hypothetical protein